MLLALSSLCLCISELCVTGACLPQSVLCAQWLEALGDHSVWYRMNHPFALHLQWSVKTLTLFTCFHSVKMNNLFRAESGRGLSCTGNNNWLLSGQILQLTEKTHCSLWKGIFGQKNKSWIRIANASQGQLNPEDVCWGPAFSSVSEALRLNGRVTFLWQTVICPEFMIVQACGFSRLRWLF